MEKKPLRLSITLLRYLTVGILAASTQFSILAFLVEKADTDPTIASGIGFFVATLLNYVLQHSWTFQSDQKHRDAFLRYSAVTSMTMCINLIFFWTLTTVFHVWYIFSQFVTTAIIAILNFMLNRHFTFNSAFIISEFRNEFTFDAKGRVTKLMQISTTIAIAIAIRFLYLAIDSTILHEDTHSFGGMWANWMSEMGLKNHTASLIPSFLPGILITIPVIGISRALYDERIAWISSLFTILHPRMVEYSCNGSSEMIPLFFLSMGIALWTFSYMKKYPLTCLFFAGFCLGFCARESIECVFAFIACLALECMLPFTSEKFPSFFSRITISFIGFASIYFIIAFTLPSAPFFTFNTHWSITEAFQLFPGIILSPLFVFAAILPIFSARPHIHIAGEIPLMIMLFLSLVLFIVQPSVTNLLPTLIPIHIFGAAGMIAFCTWFSHNVLKTLIVKSRYLVVPLILIFLAETIWLARVSHTDSSKDGEILD